MLTLDVAYAAPVLAVHELTGDRSAYSAGKSEDLSPLDIRIPAKLGTIEEHYIVPETILYKQPSSSVRSPQSLDLLSKTVIYIQDAHDSLEAQEHIAKVIRHLVRHYGVKTVYEEGYQGAVPTDKLFARFKDLKAKEKVSYFLMDKLRLGGAEYAHITRKEDFNLIGADSIELHRKNIEWYQKSAALKETISQDLQNIHREIQNLIDINFPKKLKSWIKLRDRLDSGQIGMGDYLDRLHSMALDFAGFTRDGQNYPLLHQLYDEDPSAANIEAPALLEELNRFEDDYAAGFLENDQSRELFKIYKALAVFGRLNRLEIVQEEFLPVQKMMRDFSTEHIARFLYEQTGKYIVISNLWQTQIQNALQFYQTAIERDELMRKHFRAFRDSGSEGVAVLVYGGFHKQKIKQMLEAEGLSYAVVSPAITKVSEKHQKYYRQLMSTGYHSFEIPVLLAKAARVFSTIEDEGRLLDPIEQALNGFNSDWTDWTRADFELRLVKALEKQHSELREAKIITPESVANAIEAEEDEQLSGGNPMPVVRPGDVSRRMEVHTTSVTNLGAEADLRKLGLFDIRLQLPKDKKQAKAQLEQVIKETVEWLRAGNKHFKEMPIRHDELAWAMGMLRPRFLLELARTYRIRLADFGVYQIHKDAALLVKATRKLLSSLQVDTTPENIQLAMGREVGGYPGPVRVQRKIENILEEWKYGFVFRRRDHREKYLAQLQKEKDLRERERSKPGFLLREWGWTRQEVVVELSSDDFNWDLSVYYDAIIAAYPDFSAIEKIGYVRLIQGLDIQKEYREVVIQRYKDQRGNQEKTAASLGLAVKTLRDVIAPALGIDFSKIKVPKTPVNKNAGWLLEEWGWTKEEVLAELASDDFDWRLGDYFEALGSDYPGFPRHLKMVNGLAGLAYALDIEAEYKQVITDRYQYYLGNIRALARSLGLTRNPLVKRVLPGLGIDLKQIEIPQGILLMQVARPREKTPDQVRDRIIRELNQKPKEGEGWNLSGLYDEVTRQVDHIDKEHFSFEDLIWTLGLTESYLPVFQKRYRRFYGYMIRVAASFGFANSKVRNNLYETTLRLAKRAGIPFKLPEQNILQMLGINSRRQALRVMSGAAVAWGLEAFRGLYAEDHPWVNEMSDEAILRDLKILPDYQSRMAQKMEHIERPDRNNLLYTWHSIRELFSERSFVTQDILALSTEMFDEHTVNRHLKALAELGLIQREEVSPIHRIGTSSFRHTVIEEVKKASSDTIDFLVSSYITGDSDAHEYQEQMAAIQVQMAGVLSGTPVFSLPQDRPDYGRMASRRRGPRDKSAQYLGITYDLLRKHFDGQWVKLTAFEGLVNGLSDQSHTLRDHAYFLRRLGLVELKRANTKAGTVWVRTTPLKRGQLTRIRKALRTSMNRTEIAYRVRAILEGRTFRPQDFLLQVPYASRDLKTPDNGKGAEMPLTLPLIIHELNQLNAENGRRNSTHSQFARVQDLNQRISARLQKERARNWVRRFSAEYDVDFRQVGLFGLYIELPPYKNNQGQIDRIQWEQAKNRFEALIDQALERLRSGNEAYRLMPIQRRDLANEMGFEADTTLKRYARELEIDLQSKGVFAFKTAGQPLREYSEKFLASIHVPVTEDNLTVVLRAKGYQDLLDTEDGGRISDIQEQWKLELSAKQIGQANAYLQQIVTRQVHAYAAAILSKDDKRIEEQKKRLGLIAPGHPALTNPHWDPRKPDLNLEALAAENQGNRIQTSIQQQQEYAERFETMLKIFTDTAYAMQLAYDERDTREGMIRERLQTAREMLGFIRDELIPVALPQDAIELEFQGAKFERFLITQNGLYSPEFMQLLHSLRVPVLSAIHSMTAAGADQWEDDEFEIDVNGEAPAEINIVVAGATMPDEEERAIRQEVLEEWLTARYQRLHLQGGLRVHVIHVNGEGAFAEIASHEDVHLVWTRKDYWEKLKYNAAVRARVNGFFSRAKRLQQKFDREELLPSDRAVLDGLLRKVVFSPIRNGTPVSPHSKRTSSHVIKRTELRSVGNDSAKNHAQAEALVELVLRTREAILVSGDDAFKSQQKNTLREIRKELLNLGGETVEAVIRASEEQGVLNQYPLGVRMGLFPVLLSMARSEMTNVRLLKKIETAVSKLTRGEALPENSQNAIEQITAYRKDAELLVQSLDVIDSPEAWLERMWAWRRVYQNLRKNMLSTSSVEEKEKILKDIHERFALEEIKKIQEEARQKDQKTQQAVYTHYEPLSLAWDDGLRQTRQRNWDEPKAQTYYYHGTSLGIARIAAVRGQLGGYKGLERILEIDADFSQNDFLQSASFEEIDTWQGTLPNHDEEWGTIFLSDPVIGPSAQSLMGTYPMTLESTTHFSDRTSRAARAVLNYYAFRAMWEREKRSEPFPPIDEFLQRAVLRIPKKDVRELSGEEEIATLGTPKPVPMKNAEILLAQDIRVPKKQLLISGDWAGALSERDPESLLDKDLFIMTMALGVPRSYDRLRLTAMNIAIANQTVGKWKASSDLLPHYPVPENGTWIELDEAIIARLNDWGIETVEAAGTNVPLKSGGDLMLQSIIQQTAKFDLEIRADEKKVIVHPRAELRGGDGGALAEPKISEVNPAIRTFRDIYRLFAHDEFSTADYAAVSTYDFSTIKSQLDRLSRVDLLDQREDTGGKSLYRLKEFSHSRIADMELIISGYRSIHDEKYIRENVQAVQNGDRIFFVKANGVPWNFRNEAFLQQRSTLKNHPFLYMTYMMLRHHFYGGWVKTTMLLENSEGISRNYLPAQMEQLAALGLVEKEEAGRNIVWYRLRPQSFEQNRLIEEALWNYANDTDTDALQAEMQAIQSGTKQLPPSEVNPQMVKTLEAARERGVKSTAISLDALAQTNSTLRTFYTIWQAYGFEPFKSTEYRQKHDGRDKQSVWVQFDKLRRLGIFTDASGSGGSESHFQLRSFESGQLNALIFVILQYKREKDFERVKTAVGRILAGEKILNPPAYVWDFEEMGRRVKDLHPETTTTHLVLTYRLLRRHFSGEWIKPRALLPYTAGISQTALYNQLRVLHELELIELDETEDFWVRIKPVSEDQIKPIESKLLVYHLRGASAKKSSRQRVVTGAVVKDMVKTTPEETPAVATPINAPQRDYFGASEIFEQFFSQSREQAAHETGITLPRIIRAIEEVSRVTDKPQFKDVAKMLGVSAGQLNTFGTRYGVEYKNLGMWGTKLPAHDFALKHMIYVALFRLREGRPEYAHMPVSMDDLAYELRVADVRTLRRTLESRGINLRAVGVINRDDSSVEFIRRHLTSIQTNDLVFQDLDETEQSRVIDHVLGKPAGSAITAKVEKWIARYEMVRGSWVKDRAESESIFHREYLEGLIAEARMNYLQARRVSQYLQHKAEYTRLKKFSPNDIAFFHRNGAADNLSGRQPVLTLELSGNKRILFEKKDGKAVNYGVAKLLAYQGVDPSDVKAFVYRSPEENDGLLVLRQCNGSAACQGRELLRLPVDERGAPLGYWSSGQAHFSALKMAMLSGALAPGLYNLLIGSKQNRSAITELSHKLEGQPEMHAYIPNGQVNISFEGVNFTGWPRYFRDLRNRSAFDPGSQLLAVGMQKEKERIVLYAFVESDDGTISVHETDQIRLSRGKIDRLNAETVVEITALLARQSPERQLNVETRRFWLETNAYDLTDYFRITKTKRDNVTVMLHQEEDNQRIEIISEGIETQIINLSEDLLPLVFSEAAQKRRVFNVMEVLYQQKVKYDPQQAPYFVTSLDTSLRTVKREIRFPDLQSVWDYMTGRPADELLNDSGWMNARSRWNRRLSERYQIPRPKNYPVWNNEWAPKAWLEQTKDYEELDLDNDARMELWYRWKAGDGSAYQTLMESFIPVINRIAKKNRYGRTWDDHYYAELISVGNMLMVEAVTEWHDKRTVSLSDTVETRIEAQMRKIANSERRSSNDRGGKANVLKSPDDDSDQGIFSILFATARRDEQERDSVRSGGIPDLIKAAVDQRHREVGQRILSGELVHPNRDEAVADLVGAAETDDQPDATSEFTIDFDPSHRVFDQMSVDDEAAAPKSDQPPASVSAADSKYDDFDRALGQDAVDHDRELPVILNPEKETLARNLEKWFRGTADLDALTQRLEIENLAIHAISGMGVFGLAIREYSDLNLMITTDASPGQISALLEELKDSIQTGVFQENPEDGNRTLVVGKVDGYYNALAEGNGFVKIVAENHKIGNPARGIASIEVVRFIPDEDEDWESEGHGDIRASDWADAAQVRAYFQTVSASKFVEGSNGYLVYENHSGAADNLRRIAERKYDWNYGFMARVEDYAQDFFRKHNRYERASEFDTFLMRSEEDAAHVDEESDGDVNSFHLDYDPSHSTLMPEDVVVEEPKKKKKQEPKRALDLRISRLQSALAGEDDDGFKMELPRQIQAIQAELTVLELKMNRPGKPMKPEHVELIEQAQRFLERQQIARAKVEQARRERQEAKAKSELRIAPTVSSFKVDKNIRTVVSELKNRYVIPVDIQTWTYGLSEIQRREIESLLMTAKANHAVELAINDIRSANEDSKITAQYGRLQNLPNVRFVNPGTVFNPADRKVLSIGKQGIASAWAELLKQSWDKTDFFYAVDYDAGDEEPGRVVSAIMLLDSSQESILRNQSAFDQFVATQQSRIISQLISTYTYVGQSA
ncbi:MAG: hypothetical protein H6757_05705 [Candidatus Omnitrophica bacterium]|nr:hypothetical protein [Candidatus Omnitrophota bacterium]